MRTLAVLALLAAALATTALVACEKPPPPPPPPAISASTVSASASAPAAVDSAKPQFARVDFPEVPIRAGATTSVHVSWRAPPGTGVNEEAPFRIRWHHSDALADAPSDVTATGTSAKEGFRIAVKPLDGAPNATISGVVDLVVCDMATHAVCIPVKRKIDIEFVVNKTAPAETTVIVDLPQAKPPS
jgi:hypothetical protein